MGRTYKDQRKYEKKQRDDSPKFKEQPKKRYREEYDDDTLDDYYEEFLKE
jgi:hypothetical protein